MTGDESQDSALADAVRFQHRVIVAQVTAAGRGLIGWAQGLTHYPDDTDMREFGYNIVPGTNRKSSYNATGSIPSSRYRVVQDDLSTRFLQGLLIATLICCLANWHLIHSAGGCKIVPREPNTIANVAALLADGDIMDFLASENVDSFASKRAKKGFGHLENCIFRLGCRDMEGHPEQMYSIYYVSSPK